MASRPQANVKSITISYYHTWLHLEILFLDLVPGNNLSQTSQQLQPKFSCGLTEQPKGTLLVLL